MASPCVTKCPSAPSRKRPLGPPGPLPCCWTATTGRRAGQGARGRSWERPRNFRKHPVRNGHIPSNGHSILEIYKNHTKISESGGHRCHRFTCIYICIYIYIHICVCYIYIYIIIYRCYRFSAWNGQLLVSLATTGWPCKEPRLSLVVWIDNLGWPPGCRVDS